MTNLQNNLTKKNYERVEVMSKILNVSKTEIAKSIKLFSSIDPVLLNCLHRLAQIKKKDYSSALMIFDYFLYKNHNNVKY